MFGQSTKDNFEIRGPHTRSKHAPLRAYQIMLRSELEDYLLIGGIRHPLSRMLSLYFYPGNWVTQRLPGGYRLNRALPDRLGRMFVEHQTPYWDEERFAAMVADQAPISDYYRSWDGSVRKPDYAVTFQNMSQVAQRLAAHLKVPSIDIPHMNRSLRPAEIERLSNSRDLAEFIASAHRPDYEEFDFDLYDVPR